ncbi:uncharacterized protein [Miscanthus floridulus]|uniref:uncharacterized protein n=1 Tax=Miscanthus floridulus TaxID=154761 RepID=UPI003457BC86
MAAEATRPPPQRVKGASESGEGQPTSVDTEAVPLPPLPPLRRTKDAVQKRLCPHSSWKRQVEVPALAPRKALKVSTSSTAQWVVEAQAAIQRGTASARANPKEPIAQGEDAEAATMQAGEEAPMPHEAEAHESDGAKAPSVAEATEAEAEAEAPKTFKAEATKAKASRTTEAEVAEAEAPGTTEAEVVEAGMGAAEPVAQEAKTEAGPASELEARSLGKSLFLRRERDVWDQLRQQKDLLASANEILSARSTEVEDLHLCCVDMKAKAAMAQELAAPLAARIKELEEELTRVVSEWDTFRSQAKEATASAKAIAGQLGAE